MISIRKSVLAFDQLEALQHSLVENYAGTLDDLQESAIPLRGDTTRHHRDVLKSLQSRVGSATSAKEVEKIRALLREEMLDYQRQGGVVIDGLRESVSTISRVLEEVTSSMQQDSTAETEAISTHLTRLQSLSVANDPDQIRAGLRAAISGITASVESLRRQNRLIVAQFREEIRTLHTQLKSPQPAQPQQQIVASPALARIEAPSQQSKNPECATFSLLAIWIKNWKPALQNASPAVKNQAFEAFSLSLSRVLGYRPVLNRYEEDVLMTRLNFAQGDAIRVSKDLSSMKWPEFLIPDTNRLLQWRVATGIVTGRGGESSEKLMDRFDQLSKTLKRSA